MKSKKSNDCRSVHNVQCVNTSQNITTTKYLSLPRQLYLVFIASFKCSTMTIRNGFQIPPELDLLKFSMQLHRNKCWWPHTPKKRKKKKKQRENPFAHKNSMDAFKPSIYFNSKEENRNNNQIQFVLVNKFNQHISQIDKEILNDCAYFVYE